MKISDICKTAAGGTPLKSNKKFYEAGNIPWLLSGEVGNRDIRQTKNFITQEGLDGSSAKIFPVNTVLIAMYGATAGEVGILRCESATNQAVCGIYPTDKVLPEYLYYFFLEHKDKLVAQAVGNAQPNISQQKIKNTEIQLPLLTEQKRIVAILDKAFADLEQVRAKTEQNLKNARELFDSYLNEVFKNNVLGAEHDALNDICELIVDCEHKTAPKQETGYPSIRTPNIGKGVLILEGVNRVSEETYITWTRRAVPKEDDLILAREAPAGNIGVIPKNVKVCLGQRTVLIRPKKDKLLSKYLAFLILSPKVQKQLLSHSTGATVQHINMKDIRAFKIYSLPSLLEQEKIVNGIDKILNETKKTETIYSQKIDNLDELKKSILQKAFSGELTVKAE